MVLGLMTDDHGGGKSLRDASLQPRHLRRASFWQLNPLSFLPFCYILVPGADSAAVLPFSMPYEADSAAILPFMLLYEADSDAMLHDFLPYESDHAAILLP